MDRPALEASGIAAELARYEIDGATGLQHGVTSSSVRPCQRYHDREPADASRCAAQPRLPRASARLTIRAWSRTLRGRASALPGVIPCPTTRSPRASPAVASHRSLRIHVRSHRDRREAVPRRGRHRARGRAPRRRAGQDDHPRSRPARRRRRRRRDRPPGGRRTRRSAPRSSARPAATKLIAFKYRPKARTPRQEGPPPGADGPAHQRHRARRQERGRGRQEGQGRREDRAPEARRGGRRRRRPRTPSSPPSSRSAPSRRRAEGQGDREGREAGEGRGRRQAAAAKPTAKAAATAKATPRSRPRSPPPPKAEGGAEDRRPRRPLPRRPRLRPRRRGSHAPPRRTSRRDGTQEGRRQRQERPRQRRPATRRQGRRRPARDRRLDHRPPARHDLPRRPGHGPRPGLHRVRHGRRARSSSSTPPRTRSASGSTRSKPRRRAPSQTGSSRRPPAGRWPCTDGVRRRTAP